MGWFLRPSSSLFQGHYAQRGVKHVLQQVRMTATSSGKLSVSFAFLWFGYIVLAMMEHDVSRSLFTFLSAAFRISFAVTEFTLTLAFGFLLCSWPHARPTDPMEFRGEPARCEAPAGCVWAPPSAGYASLVFEGDLSSSEDADLPCSGWASLIPRNLCVLQGTRSEPAVDVLSTVATNDDPQLWHSPMLWSLQSFSRRVGSVSDSKGFVQPMIGT